MNEQRTKELEALKDEYRRWLTQAGEANECGNHAGKISAQRRMAANVSRQIVLTEMEVECLTTG